MPSMYVVIIVIIIIQYWAWDYTHDRNPDNTIRSVVISIVTSTHVCHQLINIIGSHTKELFWCQISIIIKTFWSEKAWSLSGIVSSRQTCVSIILLLTETIQQATTRNQSSVVPYCWTNYYSKLKFLIIRNSTW